MNYMLREVSRQLQFSQEFIRFAQVVAQVQLFQPCFFFSDPFDLDREVPVAFLFAVEELGSFGSIIDDL